MSEGSLPHFVLTLGVTSKPDFWERSCLEVQITDKEAESIGFSMVKV